MFEIPEIWYISTVSNIPTLLGFDKFHEIPNALNIVMDRTAPVIMCVILNMMRMKYSDGTKTR